MLIPLAIFLVILAVIFLVVSGRQRKAAGLPSGRVVYSDTRSWGKVEKPLFDPLLSLTGKPDYLVEQNGMLAPVEVKSGWAPPTPREGHIFQLAAYCLLVERTTGKRPSHGLIAYRNRTFAVDYTPELEARLVDLLAEIHHQERQGEVHRSHEEPARCAACGYRSRCDEKLK
jgi:CRISPR-associated exonuclease Cas4